MSRSATPTTAKRDLLEEYLRRRADDGEFYFKSKFIAEDVGLSTKEIGALLVDLRDSARGIAIERWSYANATTWRVVPVDA